jgi:ubiquinone/menaquinone biosynthesis C-methylase UbiE
VNRYLPREFWTRLAKDFGESDLTGFAPVLHPGTPRWFNAVIDRLQRRTWSQTLDYCSLPQGARVLDVGCGTGRWVRRLEEHGLSVVGIDQSSEMLSLARKRGTLSPMVSGEVQNLPFRDESFECVSAVTVIQHIPPQEQVRALSEMVRVLRPGGYLFLNRTSSRAWVARVFTTPGRLDRASIYARSQPGFLARSRVLSL